MEDIGHDLSQGLTDMKLCTDSLSSLPPLVRRPSYDRSRLTAGIVHIGLGNFHRAHQAWYLHRLMDMGLAHDWAIVGAGVRSFDEHQRQKLAEQDFLTTLVELDPAGASAEIVGSIIDYVPIDAGLQSLVERMAQPDIRIVSLTVTEGGYFLDPATKKFDPSHPDVQYDIANITTPRTAFGAIIAALLRRREANAGPFTALSCDNLPGNGDILKSVVIEFAHLVDTDLGQWIESNVTFPNSMVDCIVPATGARELQLVKSLGVDDQVPVTHENFRQWVIEDNFCAGRPPLEKLGVQFSDNVHAFETQKLRILNGGHQIIAAPAEILGLETIADAMAHPLINGMLRKVAKQEICSLVEHVPGMTPEEYVDLIDLRFSNPSIHDTVRRVAFDGSSRHTGTVFPVIRDAISGNLPLDGLALSQALWARMCYGERENGTHIEPNDPVWDDLTAVAQSARDNPRLWLEQRVFYGAIGDDARFADAFDKWLRVIFDHGVEDALRRYVEA